MIYNLMITLTAILIFVTPVLLFVALVRAIFKKPIKKLLISALCSFCAIFIFAFVGSASQMIADDISEESSTSPAAESSEAVSSEADSFDNVDSETPQQNSDTTESNSEQQTESAPECDHAWYEVSRVDPTEEAQGISYQLCSKCGDERQWFIPKVEHIVTYDEIYREYKSNELRADDAYKNNRYTITATINGMATGGLLNWSGGATLTMETRVDNTIVFFYAEFEKDQEDALKGVSVGDTITFEGECLSAGSWVDCELK